MTVIINWRDHAACRETDVDLFFPIGTTGPALTRIDAAKRVCQTCPVQAQCLSWALDYGVSDGVWGGATPEERRSIRSMLIVKRSSEENDGGARRPAELAEHGVGPQAGQEKATLGQRIGRGSSGTVVRISRRAGRQQRARARDGERE